MVVADDEVPGEVRFALGPSANGKKVDELDEDAGLARAGPADGVDQPCEPGHEAVVADAQERAARDVADARGLDDDGARLAPGKALIPGEHALADEAVGSGAPGHHGRHPRARG